MGVPDRHVADVGPGLDGVVVVHDQVALDRPEQAVLGAGDAGRQANATNKSTMEIWWTLTLQARHRSPSLATGAPPGVGGAAWPPRQPGRPAPRVRGARTRGFATPALAGCAAWRRRRRCRLAGFLDSGSACPFRLPMTPKSKARAIGHDPGRGSQWADSSTTCTGSRARMSRRGRCRRWQWPDNAACRRWQSAPAGYDPRRDERISSNSYMPTCASYIIMRIMYSSPLSRTPSAPTLLALVSLVTFATLLPHPVHAGDVTFENIAAGDGAGIAYRRVPSTTNAIYERLQREPLYTMAMVVATPEKPRGAPGLALLDYDRDGDLDIYVTNGPGAANSLYANRLLERGTLTLRGRGRGGRRRRHRAGLDRRLLRRPGQRRRRRPAGARPLGAEPAVREPLGRRRPARLPRGRPRRAAWAPTTWATPPAPWATSTATACSTSPSPTPTSGASGRRSCPSRSGSTTRTSSTSTGAACGSRTSARAPASATWRGSCRPRRRTSPPSPGASPWSTTTGTAISTSSTPTTRARSPASRSAAA